MHLDLPDRWANAAPHVLPVLRGPTAPANAWLWALDNADAIGVRRPIAPFLDVVIVLDLPELRLFVNHGHLERWGVTAPVVHAQAIENLPPTTGLKPWESHAGVWSLSAGDGYDSSRLALPRWLDAFADQVDGDPIAVVPDARTLLITGTASGEAAQAVLTEGWTRFHSAGTPISLSPYTTDGSGGIRPWTPSLDHPLVHRVQACHRFHAGHAYREQHQPLSTWLGERRIADHLAGYSMLRHATGRVVTFAVWPDGPALLPRVDLVALGPLGPDALTTHPCVTWGTLVEAGIIDEAEPGLAPDRYRVVQHPADLDRWPRIDPRSYQPVA